MAVVTDRNSTGAYRIQNVIVRPAVREDGTPDLFGLLVLAQAFDYELASRQGCLCHRWRMSMLATQWLFLALVLGVAVECFSATVDELLKHQDTQPVIH